VERAQHLGILSLADDIDTENPFSELEDHDHHEQRMATLTILSMKKVVKSKWEEHY